MSNPKEPIEGKPAFPGRSTHGLSERRYYIGQALAGICANPESLKEDFVHYPGEMAIAQVDHLMSLLYPQPKETEQ